MSALVSESGDVKVVNESGIIGAEIRGVDLSRPLAEAQFRAIERALHDRGVICFRNQRIDDAGQKAFSYWWGAELDIHPFTRYGKPAHPEVFILSNILGEDGRNIGAVDAAQYWHTDLSYTEMPSRVSILYSVEIPMKDGRPLGDTEFASTAAAYDALPEDMKLRLARLKAAHYAQKPKKSSNFMKPLDEETQSKLKEVVHPVVRTHPQTGRKCLYVNHGFTTRILGMEAAESDRLLDELFDFIVQPRFMHVHKWAVGDVIVWDNCSSIHQGIGDYKLPCRRLIYRTIVKGSVPF